MSFRLSGRIVVRGTLRLIRVVRWFVRIAVVCRVTVVVAAAVSRVIVTVTGVIRSTIRWVWIVVVVGIRRRRGVVRFTSFCRLFGGDFTFAESSTLVRGARRSTGTVRRTCERLGT